MRLGVHVDAESRIDRARRAATVAIVDVQLRAASWDMSESRANSFPEADEAVLSDRGAVAIEVHLAPEDPRRFDLEHRALSKLRRVRPDVRSRYVSATSIGLFEQTGPDYGEIWYELGGRKEMSRATTAEGVLETIYALAGVDAAVGERGSRLSRPSTRGAAERAALVFYGMWPAVIVTVAFVVSRGDMMKQCSDERCWSVAAVALAGRLKLRISRSI